jgi:hypothetical protein
MVKLQQHLHQNVQVLKIIHQSLHYYLEKYLYIYYPNPPTVDHFPISGVIKHIWFSLLYELKFSILLYHSF